MKTQRVNIDLSKYSKDPIYITKMLAMIESI